jgi:uncharacterized membrane protein
MSVTALHVVLVVAAFLCTLVAGFLFAFAVVVMPGIAKLDDGDFIRAFQVVDRVIQNNQPMFMLMWIGSVLACIAAAAFGVFQLQGLDRLLVVAAALVYLFGAQLPTARINLPLNNELQKLDVRTAGDAERHRARERFESRWNGANALRTVCASVASVLFLLVLLRV